MLRKPNGLLWAAGGLAAAAGAGTVVLGRASWRWNRATRNLVRELKRAAHDAEIVCFSDLDSLTSLPSPVKRYFHAVLQDGQPVVRIVRMRQAGAVSKDGNAWNGFDAAEILSSRPRAFLWDARIHMAPLVNAQVRDRYSEGRGGMLASALGLLNMADEHDRPELNAGALHRYLGEAVWFPTSLLPSQGVSWTSIDDSSALATLSDAGTTVSLVFSFAPTGEVSGVFTPGRYRSLGSGLYETAAWGSTCTRYEEHGGMRIPMECEVYWKIDNEIRPYWRGRIVRVKYEFAAQDTRG